ncbi:hypothetical protein ACTID9_21065 [Brevibacillus fluminis]|uniref:hypothetical protein n=1 Tax=Brevibacillus fluminis TaxID=511487 RepID=UPI003F8C06BE
MRHIRSTLISVDYALLLLVSIALFFVRLHVAGPYAENWDAVDFTLALHRYDIFEMQPHFPGYPLYILLAGALLPLSGDPVLALSWTSAAAGSLALFPFFALARRFVPTRWGAWLAVLLFAASPLLSLTFVQPMSEGLGLAGVLLLEAYLLTALCQPNRNLLGLTSIGALLFGLLLGIRISYFPVGVLLFLPLALMYREKKSMPGFFLQLFITGCLFLAGLAAWLLPTAATEGGLLPFLSLGVAFTSGHFTDWGGTEFSSHLGWWHIAAIWLWDRLVVNGLLGLAQLPLSFARRVPALLLAALQLLFLTISLLPRAWRGQGGRMLLAFLLLAVLPYLAWILLGQNSEKARHLLPILPWVLLLAARGFVQMSGWITGRRIAQVWLPALIALLLIVPLALRQAEVLHAHLAPPPAKQLVDFVKARYPAQGTLTYTWEEQRLFDYYAPDYATERLQSYPYFVQSVLLRSPTVSRILLTNAVVDGFGPDFPLRANVREVARFAADPFLYPTYHTVILYELPAEAIAEIKAGK